MTAFSLNHHLSTAADKVIVGGKELPYTPFRESFASYTQDSWTYDGRLAYLDLILFRDFIYQNTLCLVSAAPFL